MWSAAPWAHRALSGVVLGALTLGCVSGCFGPVTSTSRIVSAETALERARVADAHERAPYEYHMAEEMLRKSKEEWGYSDFQASERYASESERQAKRALDKAKEDPYTGSPVSADKQAKARAGERDTSGKRVPRSETPADILDDVQQLEE